MGFGWLTRNSSGANCKKSLKLQVLPSESNLPPPSGKAGDGGGGSVFLCLNEVKECKCWADSKNVRTAFILIRRRLGLDMNS